MPEGNFGADDEARERIRDEVYGLLVYIVWSVATNARRTGSGPQRGAIVNISSIFGIRSFTSVGAVSILTIFIVDAQAHHPSTPRPSPGYWA